MSAVLTYAVPLCISFSAQSGPQAKGGGSTGPIELTGGSKAAAAHFGESTKASREEPPAKAPAPSLLPSSVKEVVDLTQEEGEGKGEGGEEAKNQPEGKHHACLTSGIPQELLLI
jgi:hypothetical protein